MREKRDPPSESKELEDVLAKIRQLLPDLHQKNHLKGLGVFGFLMVDLEDTLSRSMGRKVDLVLRSMLKKHIGERILSEVVIA